MLVYSESSRVSTRFRRTLLTLGSSRTSRIPTCPGSRGTRVAPDNAFLVAPRVASRLPALRPPEARRTLWAPWDLVKSRCGRPTFPAGPRPKPVTATSHTPGQGGPEGAATGHGGRCCGRREQARIGSAGRPPNATVPAGTGPALSGPELPGGREVAVDAAGGDRLTDLPQVVRAQPLKLGHLGGEAPAAVRARTAGPASTPAARRSPATWPPAPGPRQRRRYAAGVFP